VNSSPVGWQGQSVEGLARLSMDAMPALELLFLDGLAVQLLGPEAPEPPYTIEQGTAVASLLLRAVADSTGLDVGIEPGHEDEALAAGREAIVEGAHRFGTRGGHGVHQLVNRFLAAAVGELESHKDEPEAQVRALFYYGLMALASGPENQSNSETAESVLAAFHLWDERIGDGYVPQWRIVAPTSS
jgi:hypothetical protein